MFKCWSYLFGIQGAAVATLSADVKVTFECKAWRGETITLANQGRVFLSARST